MRNYFKMYGYAVRAESSLGPSFDYNLIAWGDTIDRVRERMEPQILWVLSQGGQTWTFKKYAIAAQWFELNKFNFGVLLHRWKAQLAPPANDYDPAIILLPRIAIDGRNAFLNPKFPPDGIFTEQYPTITSDFSVRSTWSHGH